MFTVLDRMTELAARKYSMSADELFTKLDFDPNALENPNKVPYKIKYAFRRLMDANGYPLSAKEDAKVIENLHKWRDFILNDSLGQVETRNITFEVYYSLPYIYPGDIKNLYLLYSAIYHRALGDTDRVSSIYEGIGDIQGLF